MRIRIEGLLAAPPQAGPDGQLLPATRIGWELNPPDGYTRDPAT